jgi:hypothetical protein
MGSKAKAAGEILLENAACDLFAFLCCSEKQKSLSPPEEGRRSFSLFLCLQNQKEVIFCATLHQFVPSRQPSWPQTLSSFTSAAHRVMNYISQNRPSL